MFTANTGRSVSINKTSTEQMQCFISIPAVVVVAVVVPNAEPAEPPKLKPSQLTIN